MIWFISDTHFCHKNILDFTDRPFTSIDDMNEGLVQRWNQKVMPEDTIYILGDLTLGSFKEFKPIALRLNGKKYLIKGNHDHFSNGQYEQIGITVYEELKMRIAGKIVRLSHYPYSYPWYKRLFAFKSELRFMDRRPPRIPGEFLIHGHTHTKKKRIENMIHVGVDAWNGYPVSIREVESLMNKKE